MPRFKRCRKTENMCKNCPVLNLLEKKLVSYVNIYKRLCVIFALPRHRAMLQTEEKRAGFCIYKTELKD
jgi:hypothetical protein